MATINPLQSLIFPTLEPPQGADQADTYDQPQIVFSLYRSFCLMTKYRYDNDGSPVGSETHFVEPGALTNTLSGLTNLYSGCLPPHTVAYGYHKNKPYIALYLPPQSWTLQISHRTPLTIPLPGLIVAGWQKEYRIAAVKAYPTDKTMLWRAPLSNVYETGNVCTGSTTLLQAGPKTIQTAAQTLLEDSAFNQDLSNGKSNTYPDNIHNQWQQLHETQADSYPLDDLKPMSLPLKGFVSTWP